MPSSSRGHPPPPEGLGEGPVRADEPVSDGVHDVVDVALDGRRQGLQLAQQLPLGRGLQLAEQRRRVAESLLE